MGGGHNVYDYISGEKAIDPQSIDNFSQNFFYRKSFCHSNGIQYCHLISPDKHSVMRRYFPNQNINPVGSVFINAIDNDPLAHYPVEYLSELSKSFQVFSKTDTHLSDFGDLFIAEYLVKFFSKSAGNLIWEQLRGLGMTSKEVFGDLGSKLNPKISSFQKFYNDPVLPGCTWLNNNLPGGNNGLIDLRYNSDARDDSRVVVFGDSFGRGVGKFLQIFYKEVFVFRTQYFHKEIVETVKPNILITQNVERYLPSAKSDQNAIDFFKFPNLLSPDYCPPKEFSENLNSIFGIVE